MPANLSVLVGKNFACVKIAGRANFCSSPDFKTLMNELAQKNYCHFIIDLTECVLMDSTFLGVLAGFGLKFNSPQADKVDRGIQLFNPNSRIAELLENLGVLHLFKVVEGDCNAPGGATEVQNSNASREQVTGTCLDAHKTLMNINPENVTRFKDVTAFLAEDLKRMKAAGQ